MRKAMKYLHAPFLLVISFLNAPAFSADIFDLLPSTEAKSVSLSMQQDKRIVELTITNQSDYFIHSFDIECQQVSYCSLITPPAQSKYITSQEICKDRIFENRSTNVNIPAGQQRTVRVELEKTYANLSNCTFSELRGRRARFFDKWAN